jgi:pimeloyl-ACP methyl ester carboxylesterase
MPTVRVRDINLYYESHGTGDPLLMIMGLGGSALAWEPAMIAELASSFRTIIFDNRGTGRSDKPREEYSISGMADDAAALLDVLSIDRAHIFGVSMGGMIAQEFALNHHGRVQTLTLGCTTAGGRNAVPAPPESMKILMAPRDGLSDADIMRRSWPLGYTPAYIRDHRDVLEAGIERVLQHPTPAYAYKLQLDATFKFKTFDRLPQITAPTLVITGADDVLIPARNAEIIAGRIPGAELKIIAGAGHQFFSERREEFVVALAPFLRAHPIGAA